MPIPLRSFANRSALALAADKMKDQLKIQLLAILEKHPWFMDALDAVSDLKLPQWCIGAGVIRNIVFDYLDGCAATPVRDVDVAYFDASDLSEQADRRYEEILKQRMPHIPWDVTNQAAVHLWFHKKFGYRVPPVRGIEEAVATWPETCTSVAVTKLSGVGYQVYAPCGLEDLFGMVIRRNQARVDVLTYNARISAKQYSKRWNSVRIILEWFREQVHAAGAGNRQTLLNNALREYISSQEESLEETLRRVIREELPGAKKKAANR